MTWDVLASMLFSVPVLEERSIYGVLPYFVSRDRSWAGLSELLFEEAYIHPIGRSGGPGFDALFIS